MIRSAHVLFISLVALLVCAMPARPTAQRERAMGGILGVTVYVEPNFRGANANFRNDVPDLRRLNLNDRVDSLQVARGEAWEVCEDTNYRGRCQVFSGSESNLDRVGWGGVISSMRRVTDNAARGRGQYPPAVARPRLILFEDTNYRGRSIVITDASSRLRLFNDRARSAQVYSGRWEICNDSSFRGKCVTVTSFLPDLRRVGLSEKVSSARPVR